jgi:DnaJ-class molecular chaperone
MPSIRTIEKEWRRIDRVISNPDYNPLDIFSLQTSFTKRDLKMSYYKISLLLHPDKTFNNERFCTMFTIVNKNYMLLKNSEKKSICIKAKRRII